MLTPQRKLFVDEYIRLHCKNATQAAINAGYSEKSASSQASQILNDPKVSEYLTERKNALSEGLREKFVFDALEAEKVMRDILNDPDAENRDRLAAAKDFLDRAGFKPTEKVDIDAGARVTIIDDV